MIKRLRKANSELATADKVILFVTALVGFLAIALVLGIFASVFWAPGNDDILPLIELISNAFLMLTGAIVGYIGGQGVERGKHNEYDPRIEPPAQETPDAVQE